jgi:hypothetical protein
VTPEEQLAEDRAWLRAQIKASPSDARTWLDVDLTRYRRILAVLSAPQEPVAWAIHGCRLGSMTFTYSREEMERHVAERDADGMPMYTVEAFARITAPAPHPSTVATPPEDQSEGAPVRD